MAHPAIQVEHLSKRYRLGQIGAGSLREDIHLWLSRAKSRQATTSDFWALKDVSFDVAQGEVLGIVGANGAGKSTLLKILSRITDPTHGTARLQGRCTSLLEVGTGFHPDLTGRENVYLNGAIMGLTRADVRKRFDEIVAFAGVEKFIDTPVKRYSSGMHVRLGFAVAAHLEPDILIVDEVLAVGDAAFRKKCLDRMEAVSHGEGRTVLFVSHDMPSVNELCDRCIFLEAGAIHADTDPKSAIALYYQRIKQQQEIAALSVGTRFVEARLFQDSDEATLTIHAGTKARFQFKFMVENPAGLDLGFGVFDQHGNQLYSSVASDFGVAFQTGPQEAHIEFDTEALKSGDYTVTATLWSAEQRYDHRIDIIEFAVIEPRADRLATRALGHLPCRWSLTRA